MTDFIVVDEDSLDIVIESFITNIEQDGGRNLTFKMGDDGVIGIELAIDRIYTNITNIEEIQTNLNIVISNVPCEPDVYIKAAVRMLPSGVARNALADTYENANVIGFVQSKSSSVLCDIRIIGLTPALFVGLDTTMEYFLSDITPGLIVDETMVPVTSGHIKLKLGQPFDSQRLLFIKGERVIRG